VELTVTLAILVILGTLGATGYGSVIGRARVTGDSGDLLNAIELTRSEAVKRGRRVTMLPNRGDWSAGWTIFVDTNGNRQVDPGESVILIHPAMSGTTRVIANTTPGYVAFAATGMPQQYSGGFLAATIGLCDSGTARSVVLAKTGRPRIVAATC
ncbi:MAG: GspH/FimT family protein, partial [Betaproteobacteria bacterium]